jgi:hypothetical protein
MREFFYQNPRCWLSVLSERRESNQLQLVTDSGGLDSWLGVQPGTIEVFPWAKHKARDVAFESFIAAPGGDFLEGLVPSLSRGETTSVTIGRNRSDIGGRFSAACGWAQRRLIEQLSLEDLCRCQRGYEEPFSFEVKGQRAEISTTRHAWRINEKIIDYFLQHRDELARALVHREYDPDEFALTASGTIRLTSELKNQLRIAAFAGCTSFDDPVRILCEETSETTLEGFERLYRGKQAFLGSGQERAVTSEWEDVKEQFLFALRKSWP